ncbi:hypothetical protein IWW34DRAFT_823511 [Fusarium oxysporum f. sp. albedinis]|nr:hypothetical protein IWW34DRAFT_823511 [Fusarium oxysporum f. sp. albedinis]
MSLQGDHIRLLRLSADSSLSFTRIDALCIDQQNPQERASQFAMMGDIYSHARYVLAVLSPEAEPFNLGLDYIEATSRDATIHFDPSISPHLTVQGLNGSDKLLQDSIVFLLARKVMFQCGDRLSDTAIVRKACRSWIDHENSCCWAARRPIDGSAHGFLDILSEMNSGLTIYTATLRMKHLMDMLVPGKLYTEDFLAAISLFRVCYCSDPRNRVFGYFGLLPIADLYKNLAVVLIEESHTLDVLSHDATMDDRYHLTYTERTNMIRRCRASGDMKPEWRIAEIQATALGYPSIIPGSTLGGKTMIKEWRRFADLFAYSDASPIDKPSSSERERAFEDAFASSEAALAKSCKQVIQDFDELIRQTSERRRFVVASDGQVGFGPEAAEKGDLIVIIPGGKVLYRLLGDAFINGAMAGEKVDPSTSELTKIVIV